METVFLSQLEADDALFVLQDNFIFIVGEDDSIRMGYTLTGDLYNVVEITEDTMNALIKIKE